MSVFGAIKDAIFGHDDPAPAAPAAPASPAAAAAPPPPPKPAPSREAIESVLADRAAARGETLNYKTSIVDLMKALGLDSSLENRKKLATELGYTGDQNDSASMNIWLHEKTMARLLG
ncbi:3-oxoacyl-ACP reductase-like protein [Sphingomonas sp. UYAg733]